MNKIVYIVSPNVYQEKISLELTKNGFGCTKIGSHGAYLNSGQTTMFVITNDDGVGQIHTIVRKVKGDNPNKYVPNIFIFTSDVCSTTSI